MKINTNQEKINEFLIRGVENIFPNKSFLEKELKSGKQLKLYLGIDPTGPTLHLGHEISLMNLRQFQELGHKIIMLVGSFTAMIGDPTDKLATRKPLTREQVLKNCENYKKQASVLIKFDGENPAEMKFNGDWLDKLTFKEVIGIAGNLTVQQMLGRDMFEQRIKEGKAIGLHEFLYPLMQGYDSVAMDVDGEIGGNDQTFNMLVGRDLMKTMKRKEKFVITNKLLTDTSGKKMGKSEGNMITLDDSVDEKFGKIMAWADDMIVNGFELCTLESMSIAGQAVKRLKEGANPRDLKLELAEAIVKIYHGEKSAKSARENFVSIFSKKQTPDKISEFKLSGKTIVEALVASKLVSSNSEARRNIEQGGVKINGQVEKNVIAVVRVGDVIQKGKRFFIKIK